MITLTNFSNRGLACVAWCAIYEYLNDNVGPATMLGAFNSETTNCASGIDHCWTAIRSDREITVKVNDGQHESFIALKYGEQK